jgi:hypothetical protein
VHAIPAGTDNTPNDLVPKQPAEHSCEEIGQESRFGAPDLASMKQLDPIKQPNSKREKQNQLSSFL